MTCCDYVECEPTVEARQATLKALVNKYDLHGQHCNTILPSVSYSLQQVEAPKVEPSELKAALKWLIKDYIDFHIDDAVIDVFDLPDDALRAGARTKYVVAAKEADVRSLIQIVEESGLALDWIDILELSLKNLAQLYEEEAKGVAVVRLRGTSGFIIVERQSAMYFSRHFNLAPYENAVEALYKSDEFIIELQRSLDYFERHLGQVPPQNLLIAGESPTGRPIPDVLQQNFFSHVEEIDFEKALEIHNEVNVWNLPFGVAAIGAALRDGGFVV